MKKTYIRTVWKIKDEIDLKELLNYGYIQDDDVYKKDVDWRTVYIDEDKRIITWTGDYDYDYMLKDFYDELIDDLIQANLVDTTEIEEHLWL